MRVWVVTWHMGWGEENEVHSVWSTKEAADEAAALVGRYTSVDEFVVDDRSVWPFAPASSA